MKKKIFRTFGFICILICIVSACFCDSESLVPLFISGGAILGAYISFRISGDTDEKEGVYDEDGNRIL